MRGCVLFYILPAVISIDTGAFHLHLTARFSRTSTCALLVLWQYFNSQRTCHPLHGHFNPQAALRKQAAVLVQRQEEGEGCCLAKTMRNKADSMAPLLSLELLMQ